MKNPKKNKKLEKTKEKESLNIWKDLIAFLNLQGRKDVTVHVTDLNDEAPLFSPIEVNVTLTEGNFTTGINVVTVNATDKDEGDNKRISYSIINGNLGNVFQIDNSAVRQ